MIINLKEARENKNLKFENKKAELTRPQTVDKPRNIYWVCLQSEDRSLGLRIYKKFAIKF